jgi:hypothetical protein
MNDAAAAAAIEERPLRRWLFVCFFALFALSSHGYIDNSDAEVEYQTARAIALRGSAALSAAHEDASPAERYIGITSLNSMVGQGQDQLPPEQRKVYSWFGIGHALSMVPFYGLGQLFAAILPGVEERGGSRLARTGRQCLAGGQRR